MSSDRSVNDLVTMPAGAPERARESRERPTGELGPGVTLGGKYVLLREIGKGGVGAVFAAENTWTGRRVAIKVLRPEHAREREVVARFWGEARIASSLRHPNVVDVLDVGVDDRTAAPFIVEELLDGEGYDAVLARAPGRRAAPADVLRVLVPVMDALAACHEAGVVHRDVKPSNILLCRAPDGSQAPKLIDFGVSRSELHNGRRTSATGLLFGTPHYMSPEQARGERGIDTRTDVWAMGVTLFEALTGRCPFEGRDAIAVLTQVQRESPPRVRELAPDLPADLAAAVDHALRRERDERPPTMRAFIDELLRCEAARGLGLRAAAERDPEVPPAVAHGEHREAPRRAPRRLREAALVLVPALLVSLLAIALAPRPRSPVSTASAATVTRIAPPARVKAAAPPPAAPRPLAETLPGRTLDTSPRPTAPASVAPSPSSTRARAARRAHPRPSEPAGARAPAARARQPYPLFDELHD